MTVKDVFYELARAGSRVLSGIGTAAAEVLRHADFSDTEETHELEPIGKAHRYTAFGDDRDGPESYLNPYNPHDIHK
jgi:hypothetical protein